MNTVRTVLLAIVTVLFFGGLSLAQDVRYNFDATANFAKYRTYMWVEVPGGDKLDSITDKQLKTAIEEALGTKGLSKVEGGNADMAVAYQVAITTEKQVSLTGTGYGLPLRWGGMGSVHGDTNTIPIGAVTLSMFDPGTKQLVWQGVASKQIDTGAKPEKREKNLRKGMLKLLKNYPPPRK